MGNNKRKQKQRYKTQKNKRKPLHNSVIHGNSIYTNKVRSLDGKKPDKRTCIYYDKESQRCNNNRCSRSYCMTATNCTGYKRKEKQDKKKLSSYDETYIKLPHKASIHEISNRYAAMNKNIGTPVHGTYLKSNGSRRHKARCIHYDKVKKFCKWFMRKCIGSSHCNKYKENK